jgi:SAM-dependent methyltransferase
MDEKPVYSTPDGEPTYLDIQAEVGITKHMGGYPATDRLHQMCHLDQAQEVLEVGCGIGVGPAYVAKQFGCRVVAVDIAEKMLSWARERARREGVLDHLTFYQADIHQLPFDNHRFDAVIAESVLAFVKDKDVAIRELIRVTKPGGYVGLNETYWIHEPLAEMVAHSIYIGSAIISEAEWRALWAALPLEERAIAAFPLDAKGETRDRIQWLGWRAIFAAWGRLLKLILSNPSARSAIRQQFDTPSWWTRMLGYGLFVGRKPRAAAG